MSGAQRQSAVVIYVNGAPYEHPATTTPGQSVGDFPGPVGRFDPYRIQREFPARWQAYIQANYRDLAHVIRVFHVSEKTARNWWTGATGANGAHVAMAVNEHPARAPEMLFRAA